MENYQQCTRCILDTNDDPKISFNQQGVCSYCNGYIDKYIDNWPSKDQLKKEADRQIAHIKQTGKGKKYDCIMGLSGGVDSSYLALKAKEWGLRPLLVHFDNGWNSELAVQNINGIVEQTGFDLYTYVVDWEEYRDLQLSYIKSGVIDWEVPTDHGFFAVLHKQAYKHKVGNVLAGFNHQTEAILPKNMSWRKQDLANLIDIHKQFGSVKLKTYPQLDFFKYTYYQKVLKINVFRILDIIEYNKDDAKKAIIEQFGWRDYGGKHYESIFTRFYQGYVLPRKFKVDKRRAHISNLVNSGQMTREEALEEAAKPPYPSEELLKEDYDFFLKKMGLTKDEFEAIMDKEPVDHLAYKSYVTGLYVKHEKFFRQLNKLRGK